MQVNTYAKLLEAAGQIASYGPVPRVFDQTYVDRLEAEYVSSRHRVAAALANDRSGLHEALTRLDFDLAAVRAQQLYSEASIDRLGQELRDDITAYVNATPFQKFVRPLLVRFGIVILGVVLYLWIRG
jgi:hypothetical protein